MLYFVALLPLWKFFVINKLFILFLKKTVILIIFFCPTVVAAQKSTKNNPSETKRLTTESKIKKNTYSEDEIRLAKMMKPVSDKIDSVIKLNSKKYDLLNKLSDSTTKNKMQQDIDRLSNIADNLQSQLNTIRFNFIKNNPSSFLSLDGLTMMLSNSPGFPLENIDTIKSLFNNLNKNIQNSATGRKFKLMLVNHEKSEVGSVAPDFKANDMYNKEILLSDFRNKKYVLLDFWASWCKPCREDMPFLKNIYKTYKGKGLEIIGISKDDDLSSWKKAITQDSIQIWRQISAPLKFQEIATSEVTNKYFVYGIPVKILINKEGLIIGRWFGGGKDNIDSLKKLLNKIFDN